MIRIRIQQRQSLWRISSGQRSCDPASARPTNSPASNLDAANTAAPAPDTTTSSEPQLEQRYPRYIIQRQDVLKLSFPLSPEMNQTVTVQPDGYISLQNAESLHAQGLTVPELVDALKKAYLRCSSRSDRQRRS